MDDKITDDLEEIQKSFDIVIKEMENDQEAYWNSLSEEDQLKAFCAIIRRIHKGDIVDRRSYRGVLYDVFGFGPESYMAAQCAGYLTIHNALFDWVDWVEKGEGPDDWK